MFSFVFVDLLYLLAFGLGCLAFRFLLICGLFLGLGFGYFVACVFVLY